MRWLNSSRGDTLVEVAIALAILGAVLTSAFLLSSRALRLQQTAKERVAATNLQQAQAEALRNLRDNSGWSAIQAIAISSAACDDAADPATWSCNYFFMQQSGSGWAATTPCGVAICNTPYSTGLYTMRLFASQISADEYRFDFHTSWQSIGTGPVNVTRMTTYLVNTTGIPLTCEEGPC